MAKRNVKKWYRHGNWWRRLWFNRKYKDVLFRRLFQDKQDLLDLYNALNGSTYDDPEELEVVTMEDVIFMKMKNDLSLSSETVSISMNTRALGTRTCRCGDYYILPSSLRDWSLPEEVISMEKER